jgi:hypothetical protein
VEKELVLKILGAMAAGIDPIAGDVVPPDHVLQQPDVIRALHEAFSAVQHKRAPRVREATATKQAPRKASAPVAASGRRSQIPMSMPSAPQPVESANREPVSVAPPSKPVYRPSLVARCSRLVANARASLLGPSDPALKRRRNAPKSKRWTREDALEAKRAFLAHETVTSIASRLGHDRESVLSLFKYMDLISAEQEVRGIESYPSQQASVRRSA